MRYCTALDNMFCYDYCIGNAKDSSCMVSCQLTCMKREEICNKRYVTDIFAAVSIACPGKYPVQDKETGSWGLQLVLES